MMLITLRVCVSFAVDSGVCCVAVERAADLQTLRIPLKTTSCSGEGDHSSERRADGLPAGSPGRLARSGGTAQGQHEVQRQLAKIQCSVPRDTVVRSGSVQSRSSGGAGQRAPAAVGCPLRLDRDVLERGPPSSAFTQPATGTSKRLKPQVSGSAWSPI
jgi:hypothetical protein